MTIRARLTILIFSAFVIACSSGLAATWAVQSMREALETSQRLHRSQLRAEGIRSTFLEAQFVLSSFVAGEPDDELHKKIKPALEEINRELATLRADEKAIPESYFVTLEETCKPFETMVDRILKANREAPKVARRLLRRPAYLDFASELTIQINDLIAAARTLEEQSTSDANRRARIAQALAWASFVALMTLGVVAILLLWRWLIRPVELLIDATQRISRGEREPKIPHYRRDELGQLARQIESMAGHIETYQNQLVEKERMAAVGEMAAAVAHNVRNPLASIRAVSQSLGRSVEGNGDVTEATATVIKTVDRADRWLKDLLIAMRPVTVERSPQDVNSVLREIADASTDFAEKRDVDLDMQLAPELPAAEIDPRRMTQALFSVVINAIEASPLGDTVRITSARSTVEPGMIEISISDHGPGVDEEMKQKMFTPFYGTKKSGTGVGLNLTQRIVLGHQGHILVESAPGEGLTMIVRLPFLKDGE